MDIKKWEALLASVDSGSFTAAAHKLGYTQSGLTHMMNRLESEIGFKLLSRGRNGIRLTQTGEELLPKIEALLQANAELFESIRDHDKSKSQTIRIGTYSSIARNWLPQISRKFYANYPDVHLEIHCGAMRDLHDKMKNGDFDVCFTSIGEATDLAWIPLGDDPLLAVLPADYPVGEAPYFDVLRYCDSRFLMPSFGFDFDTLPVLKDCNLEPTIIIESSLDDSALISMVEHGLGISMLSSLIMKGRQSSVITLPIRPRAVRELGMLVKPVQSRSKILRDFIDCAKSTVAEM